MLNPFPSKLNVKQERPCSWALFLSLPWEQQERTVFTGRSCFLSNPQKLALCQSALVTAVGGGRMRNAKTRSLQMRASTGLAHVFLKFTFPPEWHWAPFTPHSSLWHSHCVVSREGMLMSGCKAILRKYKFGPDNEVSLGKCAVTISEWIEMEISFTFTCI